MIDYKKLKLAHEMAAEVTKQDKVVIVGIELCITSDPQYFISINKKSEFFDELYDLILKLSSMVVRNAKYSIGQEVWRLNDEYEPHSFIIQDIDIESDEMYLEDGEGGWWVEEQLYPTRKELIEEQINHWLRMLKMPDGLSLGLRTCPECNSPLASYSGKCGDRWITPCTNKNCDYRHEVGADVACQHEPSDEMYLSNPGVYKCKKCGGFYR